MRRKVKEKTWKEGKKGGKETRRKTRKKEGKEVCCGGILGPAMNLLSFHCGESRSGNGRGSDICLLSFFFFWLRYN